jgi:hypothetical protein
MYSNVTGERDDDHIFRMDRLQVFDVLDGSFVSYVRLPSGAGRWIDDDREEPAGFVDHDLAGILMRAIASYSAGEPVSFEPHSARRVRDA